MTKPDVSIIVAVYNAENYIGRCLDSLIMQTYKNIEVICVNDASTDHSQQIIDSYLLKDERIHSIVHPQNMNAGGAMNDGIKAAQGEYVCIVDNDDWITPNAIEILINESGNLKIDFVAPDWCEFYNEERKINHHNLIVGASKEENCEYALKYGIRMLGCLIRRELFYNNDLFFPENSFFEDNAIANCLLYCANDIKAVGEVFYYYHVVDGSSSRSINISKIKDRISTTRLFRGNFIRLGFLTSRNKDIVEFRYLCYSALTIMMLVGDGSAEARKLLNIVCKDIKSMLPNPLLTQMRPDYADILSKPIFLFYYYKYCHILSRFELIIPKRLLSWIRRIFV